MAKRAWLASMALGASMAAQPAHAQMQMKGLSAGELAAVARTRTLDLRLSHDAVPATAQPLIRGMLVRHSLTSRAAVGLGLANIYAKRNGSDLRLGERPNRSRKPAVTFVLKF
jgi:hypothetical protein